MKKLILSLVAIATLALNSFSQAPEGFKYLAHFHKPLGVVILPIITVAIFWHLMNKKPSYPNSMPIWEKLIAKLTQWLLYASVFLISLSGLVMSTAGGHPIKFFNKYTLPMFMEKNKAIGGFSHEVHHYLAWILGCVIILHILAALKHHLIDKDNILKRMTFK